MNSLRCFAAVLQNAFPVQLLRRRMAAACPAILVFTCSFRSPLEAQLPDGQPRVESPSQATPPRHVGNLEGSSETALVSSPSGVTTDSPATAVISNVEVVRSGERVGVRIDGKGLLEAQAVRMQNPERLVLNFARTHLDMQERNVKSDASPIRGLRMSQYRADAVRLVIDLTATMPYEIGHEGSSLIIYMGVSDTGSKSKSMLALPVAASRTTPITPAASTTPRVEIQKPVSPEAVPPSRIAPGAPLPPQVSERNEAAARTSASAPVSTNSQPVQRIASPFGEISASAPVMAATRPLPAQGQNSTPVMPSTQAPTTPAAAQQTGGSPPSSAPPTAQQPPTPADTSAPAVPSSKTTVDDKQALSVSLNLENVDLYQVIRIIGSELKINYMVDPAVKGSVTINTSGAISRADLFSVLESILQVNGAAIVKQDSYYRIVPAADAKVQPVPLKFAKAPEALPSTGETFVLEVFPMRYVSAGEMGKVLAPFISPAGQVIVNEKGNVLLVLETPPKLKQVADLLNVFDSSTFSRQRVRLFQVTNNSAKNMIKELQDVFSGYSFTGTSAIRFVPIESLNAILAISPDPEAFKDIEAWIRQLDQPAPQQSGEQNYVYPVQNANASDLRDILFELYGGSIQKPQERTITVLPRDPMVSQAAIEEAEKSMNAQPPERIQGRLHIMADAKNNSLIIQASPHDYEIIKRTIADLDILPRQVLIDAKIYSVQLTGDLSLGISYYLGQQSSLPGPTPLNTNGSFSAGQSPGSLLASTFAILSATRGLQMFLNATDQRSRVKMLSAPSILVTDNTSARIQVGASVPIPIGSSLTPVQSGGSSVFAQTIQYQDTGVILTVTPHINASGVVSLILTQEVSSAIPNTTSGIVAPVINKSSFQTSVVLADGEPLALGGIITTTTTVSTDRIPILGQIPYAGALFGTTTRKTDRSEIVLILTPHVQQTLPQAAAQSQEFIDRMRETKKSIDHPN